MGEKKIQYCKFTQKEDNTITTLIIFFCQRMLQTQADMTARIKFIARHYELI